MKFEDFEVLTPSGWKKFEGIRKSFANTLEIKTKNGPFRCTYNHLLMVEDELKEAGMLSKGDFISTKDGLIEIFEINHFGGEEVYDLLEVGEDHLYYTSGMISHNCEFMGSSGTLISGATLKVLRAEEPLLHDKNNGFKQFERPHKDKTYVLIADVSAGKGLDYSTFSIIDVSSMPYKQVFVFRDNMITTIDFSQVIYQFATMYNEASVLIELNNMGGQVADTLLLDYGYENMIMTVNAGRSGKRITGGFSAGRIDRGIVTSTTVKATGCSVLKMLVEQKELLINDIQTIEELMTFSKKGNSYEAEPGKTDDLVMPLVLFAWMTNDPYFKELTDINTLAKLREKSDDEILESVLPFGFVDDGLNLSYPIDPLF